MLRLTACLALALASSLLASEPGWKVEGWLQGDYTASSARRSNLPVGFNRLADDGHLHQAWLSLDHAHVHADLYVGTDYFSPAHAACSRPRPRSWASTRSSST